MDTKDQVIDFKKLREKMEAENNPLQLKVWFRECLDEIDRLNEKVITGYEQGCKDGYTDCLIGKPDPNKEIKRS